MNEVEIQKFIISNYPATPTQEIADFLDITSYKVRSIAKRHNVKKSEAYLAELKLSFVESRRKWYLANIPEFEPTFLQEQIIFGSLLGDGYISKGAQRSKNFYYQEHFGESQREYRMWKLSKLKNLGFKINGNYLRSPSHPYFTKLQPQLYDRYRKILSTTFINRCTSPMFLTTLYLDDGSLVLSYTYNKAKQIVYCHPSIILYTLNLTYDENKLLANHLNNTFRTSFVVSGHPDGNSSLLKINKEKEVQHLLNVIEPYTSEIPSMHYKSNINVKIKSKMDDIYKKYGQDVTIKQSSSSRNRPYSTKEIETLIGLKQKSYTDQQIADTLQRSYWSIVYKIRELRNKELL